MKLRFLLTTCLLLLGGPTFAADVELHGESRIHFATKAEGVKALAAKDRFLRSMSRFDIESRLGKLDGTPEELVKWITAQVRPWSEEDQAKLTKAVTEVRERLEPYDLPFPKTVLLIHTTGKEEGQAAYCRGNAVVLPRRMVRFKHPQLTKLLLHELFHVLSNQNPKWREKMYAIVGFQPCPEIALPDGWKDRKLTNPDAPQIDNLINVTIKDRKLLATPVLYSSEERYDAEKGGSFFQYMTFRLMEVEKADKGYRAVIKDGDPVFHEATATSDYLRQIGENTRYIIHPDEILADNFALLTTGVKDAPTPRILQEIKLAISKKQDK